MQVYAMKGRDAGAARRLEKLVHEATELGVCRELDMLLSGLDSTVVEIRVGGSHEACSSEDLIPHPGYHQDAKTYAKCQRSSFASRRLDSLM